MDQEFMAELYQSLVLEHSRRPRNFGTLNTLYQKNAKNPSCGDQLTLFLDIQDNIINNVTFQGEGCALCMSSASLMTQSIKGKTLEDVKKLFSFFSEFILEEKSLPEQYEPLHIYENVHNFPLRVKCVLLPWRTLEYIIYHFKEEKKEEKEINTEDL